LPVACLAVAWVSGWLSVRSDAWC
jgi:hypothetical protein